jgi:hypothetical protein
MFNISVQCLCQLSESLSHTSQRARTRRPGHTARRRRRDHDRTCVTVALTGNLKQGLVTGRAAVRLGELLNLNLTRKINQLEVTVAFSSTTNRELQCQAAAARIMADVPIPSSIEPAHPNACGTTQPEALNFKLNTNR